MTIHNDDIVFLSIADEEISETAGEVQFTVTLSMASAQTVSVAYESHDGTARSGSDYVAVGPLRLEIPAGQMAGTIEVQIAADDIYEQDEQFVLELTMPVAAQLATATAAATIVDDESPPTLAVATATVGESDGSVAVTITLTGRAEAVVSVNLSTVSGTALAAEDYESHDSVVTWASTETGDKTVNVDIVNDAKPEDPESFDIQLSGPDNADIAHATAAVTINDVPAVLERNGEEGASFWGTAALVPRENEITVVATDNRGNQAILVLSVRANAPPRLPFLLVITEPRDLSIVSTGIIRLSGRTGPEAVVSVKGISLGIDEVGKFSTLVALEPGPNIIDVVSTNSDGQVMSTVAAVIYRP